MYVAIPGQDIKRDQILLRSQLKTKTNLEMDEGAKRVVNPETHMRVRLDSMNPDGRFHRPEQQPERLKKRK